MYLLQYREIDYNHWTYWHTVREYKTSKEARKAAEGFYAGTAGMQIDWRIRKDKATLNVYKWENNK